MLVKDANIVEMRIIFVLIKFHQIVFVCNVSGLNGVKADVKDISEFVFDKDFTSCSSSAEYFLSMTRLIAYMCCWIQIG